MHEEL
jgi:hypothetical protein